MTMTTVTALTAPDMLTHVLKAGLVPMLTSSPGIGKSDIIKQIAKKANLKVIDLRLSQCDPSDLNGFPTLNAERTRSGYAPMNTFPIAGDELPMGANDKPMNGWLLFLDEFNSAPMSVQAAAYKIVLDREVGLFQLHSKVAVIAAGNLSTDRAITNRLSTAMQSRLIHFQMEINHEAWIAWANSAGIDYRIIAYIGHKPDILHKFDPDHNDKTFACPRTWEFLSRLIKDWKVIDYKNMAIMAGTVSEGVAREFLEYSNIFQHIPTINEIIANPAGFAINEEPSHLFAISNMISAYLDEKNDKPLIKAIERLPIEFQTVCLQGAIAREPKVMQLPAVRAWIVKNAQELM